MKRLLLLLMISLLVLGSCETYCERNFPSETVILLPPEPSINEVGYPGDSGPLVAILFQVKAGELSDDQATSQILSEYAFPLLSLVENWKSWAQEVKDQIE